MDDLLNKLEAAKIPAPSPIEQRWTCGSASHMSPASAASQEGDSQDHLFSWVGIIMYLPPDNNRQRAAITKRYGKECCDQSCSLAGACENPSSSNSSNSSKCIGVRACIASTAAPISQCL